MLEVFKRCPCVLMLLNFLFIGCGKDRNIVSNGNGGGQIDPIVVSEKERIAKEHSVYCETFAKCNESITKIVVFDKGSAKERTCTGFLIGQGDVVMTSASCLPSHLKAPLVDCSEDVYFHFPEAGRHEKQMVGCHKITNTSIGNEGLDSAAVYADVAYIQMSQKLERNSLKISQSGISEGLAYGLWRIRTENSKVGIIVQEYCSAVYGSYANPLTVSKFSPNTVMKGCSYEAISSGSPLVDFTGYVRGILNKTISNDIKNFFWSRNLIIDSEEVNYPKISRLNYFTNLACAFTPEEKTLPSECNVELSNDVISSKRQKMIESNGIHNSYFVELADRLSKNSKANKHVKWNMEFEKIGLNHYKSKLVPVCFDDYDNWKKTIKRKSEYLYNFPAYTGEVKLMFDADLKPKSVSIDTKNYYYDLKFYPKKLRDNPRKSKVELDNNVIKEEMGLCQ